MKCKLVIDGNAVYEIDDECIRKKEENEKKKAFAKKKNSCYKNDKRPG